MCVGGGGGPLPQPKFLKREDPPPGPPSPQDMVNNMNVDNINDRSLQDQHRNANRGSTASKQKTISTNKTDKAY